MASNENCRPADGRQNEFRFTAAIDGNVFFPLESRTCTSLHFWEKRAPKQTNLSPRQHSVCDRFRIITNEYGTKSLDRPRRFRIPSCRRARRRGAHYHCIFPGEEVRRREPASQPNLQLTNDHHPLCTAEMMEWVSITQTIANIAQQVDPWRLGSNCQCDDICSPVFQDWAK